MNNYWADNSGHAFEGEDAYVLVEGSTFDNVANPSQDFTASLYAPTSSDEACQASLGRACVANTFTSSGSLEGTATSVLDQFSGLTVAEADADASSVPSNAGVGKISSSKKRKRSARSKRAARSSSSRGARGIHQPRRLWAGADEEDVVAF